VEDKEIRGFETKKEKVKLKISSAEGSRVDRDQRSTGGEPKRF